MCLVEGVSRGNVHQLGSHLPRELPRQLEDSVQGFHQFLQLRKRRVPREFHLQRNLGIATLAEKKRQLAGGGVAQGVSIAGNLSGGIEGVRCIIRVEEDVMQQIDALEDVELHAGGEEGTRGEEEVHREEMLVQVAQRDAIASVREK